MTHRHIIINLCLLHHSYNSPVSVINRGNLTFFYARMVFLGNGKKKVFGGFEIKKKHIE